jgi:hypothetical protein
VAVGPIELENLSGAAGHCHEFVRQAVEEPA